MKKVIYLFLYVTFLFPSLCIPDDEPTICRMDMSQFAPDSIPNYLQPWWNNLRIGKFAVVYVDFPDGRYINGNDTLQPFYDWQLEWVNSHGVLDAAGEMGLVLEPTNIPAGNKYVKASKYTYYDRWNMFFDSLGVYNGTAHPDWASNGDSAYGSMKQYYKEASNGKFELIPYVTRPNETNYKFKTGIVNNYVFINGVPIIKCVKLPKKKYGSHPTNSYFRNDTDFIDMSGDMIIDTKQAILNQCPDFNLNQFLSEDGILFIYFAGYHRSFKDVSSVRNISPIVSREKRIDNPESRIDGFGVSAHQFGHMQFGWGHTNSGRCDIMDGFDVHDNNCPQLPNPVYRMKQGWLQPIALDSIQQITNLPPVETSFKVGVVTIYGKPSAAPDWSSGESFVVENRRRLGFDRKIINEVASNNYPNFKGGLLVWHYSPYTIINDPYGSGATDIKFISADTTRNLLSNRGNPPSFYAWTSTPTFEFHNLDSSKTYSAENLKTGIELRNIEQVDYNSLNSNINFDLKYLIALPTRYSPENVIYNRGGSNHIYNISGLAFFHRADESGFFKINPGAIIETPGGTTTAATLEFRNLEAKGLESSPIIFRGVGYTSTKTTFGRIYIDKATNYSDVDTLILSNLKLENTSTITGLFPEGAKIFIYSNNLNYNPIPMKLNNIILESNLDYHDIEIWGSPLLNYNVAGINLQNLNLRILNGNYFYDDNINLESCGFDVKGTNAFFNFGKGIYLNNSTMKFRPDNRSSSFDKYVNNESWNGINIIDGGIDLLSTNYFPLTIKNALIGVDITNAIGVKVENIRFENNRDYDISIYKINNETSVIPLIRKNIFTQTNHTEVKISSILISECPNINIDSNILDNTGYFGIISLNNESPFINFNNIIGGNINGTHSSGIFSYNSNGNYKCNKISQCMNYGILLDNSQPVLFNNEIYVNGLGLYLTNNSNPIMTPSYLNDETYVIGGYNYIHHNASQEIYCNNSRYNYNAPIMYKGYNSIEDIYPLVPDTLIFNKEISGTAFPIDVISNYWGGNSPSGRLIPNYSFTYNPYLTGQLSYACDFGSDPADNSSLSSEYLLLGNVLKNQHQENFNAALSFSNQLLSLQNSQINPIISLNNLFTSTLFSNGNFTNLENFYLNQISQNPDDTILNNKLINLSIESKIERNELEMAISEYDDIMNNSTDEEVRFYVTIDRSRAIRLMLDSLLSYYQGDNLPENINQLYNDAINYQITQIPYSPELISKTNRTDKIKTKNEKRKVNSNPESNFAALKKNITEKINNFENLNTNEKRNLIIEKNILDIAVNNYVEGIASIKDKLQFLKQEVLELPLTYKLNQNYPNPFNPTTTISYTIPIDGIVKIKVYDITGKEIKILENEFKTAGSYSVNFNGSNLASGVYFYKLELKEFSEVKRMLLIK
ncbi:MAG: T9SS type A sorting domain-containing protein [Bacteroidota bacterium]|nr:T9SS type A sorting domain-containing protein [Bacteroidota bacterium]